MLLCIWGILWFDGSLSRVSHIEFKVSSNKNLVIFPFCDPVAFVHDHLSGFCLHFLSELFFYFSRVGVELTEVLLGEVNVVYIRDVGLIFQ